MKAKAIATSGGRVYVAIPNPFAGRRGRYTLWSLAISGMDTGAGTPDVLGREITLAHCRQISTERGGKLV